MPATKIPVLTLSVTAAALVLEHRALTQAGNYPAAGAKIFGVGTEDAEAIGAQVPVDVIGTTIGEAGAAIALDADLEVNASGQFITRAAGVSVAKAMQAAGALGDKLEVMLLPK
jgi:hypothetical protein